MINNNSSFSLDDFYTSQPIEQHTDRLANQTSFCLHFHNVYDMSERCQVKQINEIKCKYCRAFYFPQTNTKKKYDSSQYKKLSLKNIINDVQELKKFTCELCGSINEIKGQNFIKLFPKFAQLTHRDKGYHYNSNFQSVILSQSKSVQIASKVKTLHKNENELIFMFCIDLDSLSQNLQLSTLTYLKTVVKQYFLRHIENSKNRSTQQQNDQAKVEKDKQNYSILLTFNINEKLFVADLNTMSTICIDSLLKQKVVSGIPGENIQQITQKQNQRKQNLIELLYKSSIRLDSIKHVSSFQQYMDMLIQERQYNTVKSKLSVQGSINFTKLMQLLSFDRSSCHYYVISWISATPILNYESHRVKKSNIYSLVYLFSQQNAIETKNKSKSNTLHSDMKFQQTNVRNELLLIKENNEVRFINVSSQEENPQFYYLLYELFSIVDSPKIFRPRWSIKTDAKYPPVLTNDPPTFFIKNPTMLYFIVSSLIDKGGHNKFQLSVQFQDWKKEQHVWIINWTKDSQKQNRQLKGNSHKQIQLIPKMPQIFNYFHILVKFIMNVAIRGKNDISLGKKQLMTLNTMTGNQFCMIIESMINRGVFRANNIQIGIEYLSKLYEYLNEMKNIPFQVLRFLSCCQYNIRSAILMIFPLIIYGYHESSCIIYWSSGYLNVDNQDDNNDRDDSWKELCMSALNEQYESKYYTNQFFLPYEDSDDKSWQNYQDLIVKHYAKSTGIIQFKNQKYHQQNSQLYPHQNHHFNQSKSTMQKPHAINDKSLNPFIQVYFMQNQEQYDPEYV